MLHSSLSYMGARGHHVKQRDFPRLEARDIRLSFSTYIYGVLDLFVSASFGTPRGRVLPNRVRFEWKSALVPRIYFPTRPVTFFGSVRVGD